MTTLKQKNIAYYKLSPSDIVSDLQGQSSQKRLVNIKGIEIFCHPHVYPSEQFRTTNFLLETIRPFVKNAHLCDMGCGPGIVGIYALYHGANQVTQSDINPYAIENAKENKIYNEFPNTRLNVYLSDCFDSLPPESYDIIVFNPPFHEDNITISDPLQYAFFDPGYKSIKKFLDQAINHAHKKTKIFISFSNKGNIKALENLFEISQFHWELFKVKNQDKEYDNRIYLLKNT